MALVGDDWKLIDSQAMENQKQAVPVARRIAKKKRAELLIHGKDGKVRQKNSYGNDPRGVKG